MRVSARFAFAVLLPCLLDSGAVYAQTAAQPGLPEGDAPLLLNASSVSARVEPVTVVADTVEYNAAAFRVPEDAMLDDLLKKIPGLEIDGSGRVTLQGREIKQIYVNGQRFFGGDVKTGLRNLQANMVEKVRAYDRPSDFSRITGIDDGEEEPVLDLKIKKNMLDGWRGSVNAGGGTQKRYRLRNNASKITKDRQMTALANIYNTNGGTSVKNTSRNQLGSGGTGERMFAEAGFNFSKKSDVLELSSHVYGSWQDRTPLTSSFTESVNSRSVSYNRTAGQQFEQKRTAKAGTRLEWRPSKQITLLVVPEFNFSYLQRMSRPDSKTFDNDPRLDDSDPVNGGRHINQTFEHRYRASLNAQLTVRSRQKRGRNFTVRLNDVLTPVRDWYFNNYNTVYYRKAGKSSLRNQYIDYDPSTNNAYLELSYNEPFAKRFHVQASVRGDYRYARYRRHVYTLYKTSYDEVKYGGFPDWTVQPTYRLREQLCSLPSGYEDSMEKDISPDGRYDFLSLAATLQLRYVKKKFNLSAGVTARPQWTFLQYSCPNGMVGENRKFLFNAAPQLTLRYNPKKTSKLSLTYRSWVSTPSLYNLLDVSNGTSPTDIHIGNPDLLPCLSQRAEFQYQFSNLKKQCSVVTNASFLFMQNSSVSKAEYDRETGTKTVIPVNVDGNWKANASVVYNQAFRDNRFSLTNNLYSEYVKSLTYLYDSPTKTSSLNVAYRLMVKEMLDLRYRNHWLELVWTNGVEFTSETNRLRPDLNQKPLCLSSGLEATVTLPWKMRIGTDFTFLYQNGFGLPELNRNYYLWNAEIAQTLLKGRATLKFSAYDILRQQVNMTRSFSSTSRNMTIYNGVSSYLLLSFIYRFKI